MLTSSSSSVVNPSHPKVEIDTCPESKILQQIAAGDFSDASLTATIGHLQTCDRCRHRFEELIRADLRRLSPVGGDTHHAADTLPHDEPPLPHEIGPGFQVIESLGAGGMGSVLKCYDIRLGRTVAVKLVRNDRITPDQLERTAREARAQASLNHANIVPVYEIGQHAGLPMIVMEFLPGGSLRDRIARAPLQPRQAAGVVAAIARGLDHAHANGVVHRDLKPSNILLTDGDLTGDAHAAVPKIADFGLAKFLSEGSDLTAADAIPGTPAYLAPELIVAGEKQATPASDLYALGVILYECLTGRPPFAGASFAQLAALIAAAMPVSPRELTAGISRDLETICLKCLQKNPAHRYATAWELAQDLDAFLAGRPIQARPVTPLVRSWRWCLRNRRLAAAIAVAVVSLVSLAVGGVAVAFSQAKLRHLADQNGQLAIAQARKAAASEHEALYQRDQARIQFVESSRVLHDIGSLLSIYQFTKNDETDLKSINREFQRKVLELTVPYLKRTDLHTDSPEMLPMSLFNAARAYEQLGNEPEAVRHFESLLELMRTTEPPHNATETFRHLTTASTLSLAEIHKRNGRLDLAIALLEPFWNQPVDPVTKRPPDPADTQWLRLRNLFGAKLRELYEMKGLHDEARRIDEEIRRLSANP